MAVAVWNVSYVRATIAPTNDGELMSVALLIGTSPLQVWFRRSTTNGTVWPSTAPYAPVLVGDLGSSTSKVVRVHQMHAYGSSRILVDNGIDKIWYSDDYGATWQAF